MREAIRAARQLRKQQRLTGWPPSAGCDGGSANRPRLPLPWALSWVLRDLMARCIATATGPPPALRAPQPCSRVMDRPPTAAGAHCPYPLPAPLTFPALPCRWMMP
jgi:hypothetical protein